MLVSEFSLLEEEQQLYFDQSDCQDIWIVKRGKLAEPYFESILSQKWNCVLNGGWNGVYISIHFNVWLLLTVKSWASDRCKHTLNWTHILV